MKIPKKIKVGGIEYKVEIIKEAIDSINSEAVYSGRVDYKKQKVYLLGSQSHERKCRTLLHEIIHILDDDLKINFEENAICRLEAGLYSVLKENNLLKE